MEASLLFRTFFSPQTCHVRHSVSSSFSRTFCTSFSHQAILSPMDLGSSGCRRDGSSISESIHVQILRRAS